MCQPCFESHWGTADRLTAWLTALPDARHEAIRRAEGLILAHPGTRYGPRGAVYGITGGLHAAVEDDNYDCTAGRYDPTSDHPTHEAVYRPAEANPLTVAAYDAWDALSEDERSLVVAHVSDYALPPGWTR